MFLPLECNVWCCKSWTGTDEANWNSLRNKGYYCISIAGCSPRWSVKPVSKPTTRLDEDEYLQHWAGIQQQHLRQALPICSCKTICTGAARLMVLPVGQAWRAIGVILCRSSKVQSDQRSDSSLTSSATKLSSTFCMTGQNLANPHYPIVAKNMKKWSA